MSKQFWLLDNRVSCSSAIGHRRWRPIFSHCAVMQTVYMSVHVKPYWISRCEPLRWVIKVNGPILWWPHGIFYTDLCCTIHTAPQKSTFSSNERTMCYKIRYCLPLYSVQKEGATLTNAFNSRADIIKSTHCEKYKWHVQVLWSSSSLLSFINCSYTGKISEVHTNSLDVLLFQGPSAEPAYNFLADSSRTASEPDSQPRRSRHSFGGDSF